MRTWVVTVPIIGACALVAVPLLTYANRQRSEDAAVNALREIQAVQARFHAAFGSYATDMASLAHPCFDHQPTVSSDTIESLAGAGYLLSMRRAAGGTEVGHDCHGRTLASNYYVAVAPASPSEAAITAFAGTSEGRLYAFVDGVPPREAEMASGLATPVDALDTFKIP